MRTLNSRSCHQVVTFSKLGVQLYDGCSLFFELSGISCLAYQELFRKLYESCCILLLLVTHFHNLIFQHNAVFKSSQCLLQFLTDILSMEFEFLAVTVKGKFQFAVDFSVKADHVELRILLDQLRERNQILLNVFVDAQITRHVFGHHESHVFVLHFFCQFLFLLVARLVCVKV